MFEYYFIHGYNKLSLRFNRAETNKFNVVLLFIVACVMTIRYRTAAAVNGIGSCFGVLNNN